jgi:hypothetical protein
MGGVFSGLKDVSEIPLWPVRAMSAFDSGAKVGAFVGLVAGVGLSYGLMGNPIPLIQQQEYVSAVIAYVLVGIGYTVAYSLYSKESSQ